MEHDDATVRPGSRVHPAVTFLVPFVLACIGSADLLAVAASAWGEGKETVLFMVALGLWALMGFGMYRTSTVDGAATRRLYRWSCAFAFFSGALCAAEPSGGFLVIEAAVSAFVIASVCVQAAGYGFTDTPRRISVSAGVQFLCLSAMLVVSDIDLSLDLGGAGFVLAIVFLMRPYIGSASSRRD